jgi:heat shock protein HtpX
MNQDQVVNHTLLNWVHTILLFGGLLVLLGILGLSLAGARGVLWTVILAVPLFLIGGRLSPALVLRMAGARPLAVHEAPKLHTMLHDLARRANLPRAPQLYYVPSRATNAFSVGSQDSAAIGITDGLVRALSTRELTGVMAHEVTHIRHNDMRVMGLADLISRTTGLFSMLGQVLLFVNLPLLLIGRSPISWWAVVLLVAAPRLSSLLQLALSRTREFDADLGAARLTGDPAGLASALQKMSHQEASIWRQVMLPGRRVPDPSLLRTHPDIDERVRRLMDLAGPGRPPAVDGLEGQVPWPVQVPRDTGTPLWRSERLWLH